MKKYNVGILGATGAVGREMLKVLEERNFPMGELRLLASARSVGKKIPYCGKEYEVQLASTEAYEGLDFVEIYNHSCTMAGEDSYIIKAFDDILRDGKKIYATMCDDSHKLERMFGGWVMINADRLDYKTIMEALKNGDFYCSNGPEIYSLVRDGNTVTIKTSPAKRIALSTGSRRCGVLWGAGVTEATFKLEDSDGYFRISVDDIYGNHAHTQAYEVSK